MSDAHWPRTWAAIRSCEPPPVDEGEEPVRGNWLLRQLAEESGGRMVELAPGVFYESTLDPPVIPGE